MRKAVTIFFVFYILSCGGGDNILSEQEIKDQAYGDMTTIRLSMSEDLELTLLASKFEEPVSIMSFEVIYNVNALNLKSFSAGDFGLPGSNLNFMDVNNDTTHASFFFTESISDTGELLKLKFQGSESAYKATTIFLRYLMFYDSNNNEINFDENGFFAESICYISKQCENCEEQSDELLFDGAYQWSNAFCNPLNYSPTP